MKEKLKKHNTPENFYKLVMFVAAAADEGLSIGNCDASDLLYCDVLSGAEDTVYDTLGQKAEDFVCKYESWGAK